MNDDRTLRPPSYFLGLDLGQAADFSAFAAAERTETRDADNNVVRQVAIRALHRWPLGTPYTAIAGDVARFLLRPPLAGGTLIVDATGVGRPVIELIRKGRPRCGQLIPVMITAGGKETQQDDGWHVAKVPLISTLQVLLQSQRLRFAEGMAETPTLLRELENYRVKTTAAMHETFDARSGEHDDLVLAVALACWGAERFGVRRLFAG